MTPIFLATDEHLSFVGFKKSLLLFHCLVFAVATTFARMELARTAFSSDLQTVTSRALTDITTFCYAKCHSAKCRGSI